MIATAPTDALQRYIASADPEAFRELLVAYRPMVFGVCVRVLADTAAAEDATQETFVLLSRHAWSIRTSVGAWLYACALNEARRIRPSSRWLPQRIADAAMTVLHVAREVADLLLRLVGGLFTVRKAPPQR